MKKLRLFDSLKFVRFVVAVVATLILNVAHADNTWKYAPLPIGYAVNSDLLELTESNESFNTYTVKETKNTSRRMLYITNANPLPANHKYFMRVRFNSNLASLPYFRYMLDGTYTNLGYSAGYNTSCRKNEWCNVAQIITPQQKLNLNGNSDGLLAVDNSYIAGETITIDKNGFLTVFDLTEIFGAGNEPATAADAERALSIDTTIKIATTRYSEEQFEPVQNRLSAAVNAVEDVVTQTMAQAQAIDTIATTKQTRPVEGCTAKYCLLVEDEQGVPHWYPIAGANGVAHALPAGYTELQYIESNGTQWIDTGIYGTEHHGMEIKFNFPTLSSAYSGRLCGGRTGASAANAFAYIGTNLGTLAPTNNAFYMSSNNGPAASLEPLDTNVHTASVNFSNNQKSYFDGQEIQGIGETTAYVHQFTTNLFRAYNGTSGWATPARARIYFCKITNSGELVRDFIPAKNSSGVVGMYDTVSGQFFTNAGTGVFTGPEM